MYCNSSIIATPGTSISIRVRRSISPTYSSQLFTYCWRSSLPPQKKIQYMIELQVQFRYSICKWNFLRGGNFLMCIFKKFDLKEYLNNKILFCFSETGCWMTYCFNLSWSPIAKSPLPTTHHLHTYFDPQHSQS